MHVSFISFKIMIVSKEQLPYGWPKNKQLPSVEASLKAVRMIERKLRINSYPRLIPVSVIENSDQILINL